ncbi:hypothetical protein SRHO_G00000800 [Serrasalmus rhombeus]
MHFLEELYCQALCMKVGQAFWKGYTNRLCIVLRLRMSLLEELHHRAPCINLRQAFWRSHTTPYRMNLLEELHNQAFHMCLRLAFLKSCAAGSLYRLRTSLLEELHQPSL